MSLASAKSFLTKVLSYIRPVKIRESVLVNGEDDVGTVAPEPKKPTNPLLARYVPYESEYILIGMDRDPESGAIYYRFYDAQLNKEFLLTKGLMDILFYKKP